MPRERAAAGTTTTYDDAVRASHAEAMAELGPHVGTPIIATTTDDGTRVAFFGPVISQVPTGERAGDLWDGTLLVAATPGFHELKATAHAQPRR
ncbi:mycothiol-dependent nitroreductase Rv2466c family protein [Actinophytocola sediminis]